MENQDKVLIINTGGTFNKVYNHLNGKLIIKNNNKSINSILHTLYRSNKKPIVKGIIYKDSLDIKKQDRKKLIEFIKKFNYRKIIIIHGTDTMDKTAKYIDKRVKDKKIVLVGAMQPFSYDKIESTGTLMMAIGFLSSKVKNNVYISMSGIVIKYNKIKKNYEKGLFECQ